MKKPYYLYILLTDTGTLFTKTIKAYTGEPFNHASLAFDEQLREVYSFGRKQQSNPFFGGFVAEDMLSPLFLDEGGRTRCALYRLEVSQTAYARIRRRVAEFQRNSHEYSYNLLGLFALALGIRLQRSKAYFCSQFVAETLLAGDVCLSGKHPEFTSPADLVKPGKTTLLYIGPLRDYSPLASRLGERNSEFPAGATLQTS